MKTVNPLKIQEYAICIPESVSKESTIAKEDTKYKLMIYIAILLVYGLGTLKSDIVVGSIAIIQAAVGLIAYINCCYPIVPFIFSLLVTQSVTFYGVFKYLMADIENSFYVMWILLQLYTLILTIEIGKQVST